MNGARLGELSDQIGKSLACECARRCRDWVFQEAKGGDGRRHAAARCFTRLERGVIYPPNGRRLEIGKIFSGTDAGGAARAQSADRRKPLEARETAKEGNRPSRRAEKILVNVTADPSTAMLLRRARALADYITPRVSPFCFGRKRSFRVPGQRTPGDRAPFHSPRICTSIRPSCKAKSRGDTCRLRP